ncbi:MAG: phytanoyl-CoA dioxygenase family protein [Caldilineaceae bacterium]
MSEHLLHQWQTEGYLIVRKVFTPERTAQLRTICDAILEQWRVCNPETGQPGGKPEATVMRHLNHPDYYQDHPAWLPILLEAAGDETVRTVAHTILQEEPLFRCTSYFFDPLAGSRDGNWHRDSQFSHREDAAEEQVITAAGPGGRGFQMQIALVPSDDIEYVPGSHLRWDTPAEYAIRKADNWAHNESNAMPGALRVDLAAGDGVLFNPMGIHRGRYHVGKLRRTLMLTYTAGSAKHVDYFSMQPWCLTPAYLRDLQPATHAFFTRFIDCYREDWTASR